MEKQSNEDQRELLLSVLNAVGAAGRTTQLRLFHGLVPTIATLRDSLTDLEVVTESDWFRAKRRTQAMIALHTLKAHIIESIRTIETRAAELGFPLGDALASYTSSGAGLRTLAAMQADLETIDAVDWDAWSASFTDQPGDTAS